MVDPRGKLILPSFSNNRLSKFDITELLFRSSDSSSCSSRDPSPCARGPTTIQHAPVIRRQSTTEEILIARGFRRQSTTEEMIRCRNFRRQSSQSDDTVRFSIFYDQLSYHSRKFTPGTKVQGSEGQFSSNHRWDIRNYDSRNNEHILRQQYTNR